MSFYYRRNISFSQIRSPFKNVPMKEVRPGMYVAEEQYTGFVEARRDVPAAYFIRGKQVGKAVYEVYVKERQRQFDEFRKPKNMDASRLREHVKELLSREVDDTKT